MYAGESYSTCTVGLDNGTLDIIENITGTV